MIPSETLRSALQSLRSNGLRTLLTTLGIVIGVASVVMVIQLIKGMETRIMQEVQKQNGTVFSLSSYPGDEVEDWRPYPEIDATQIQELKTFQEGILVASPEVFGGWGNSGIALQVGTLTEKTRWVASDEHGMELNNMELASGRGISATDRLFRRPVLVLAYGLALKMGLDEKDLGRQVVFGGQTAEVIGLLKPSDGPMTDEDSNSNQLVIIPFGAFREVLPAESFSLPEWTLLVSRDQDPVKAEDAIRSGLRALRGVKKDAKDNFTLRSQADNEKEAKTILRILMGTSSLLMSLSLLVGGIGVMNIMLVSVTERTREIGVRKAMGAPQAAIRRQFLVEAVLLCLLGGVIGLLLGTAAGQVMSRLLFKLAGFPSLLGMFVAFLVPTLVGLAFGFFPARKAAKMDPIEALRYE